MKNPFEILEKLINWDFTIKSGNAYRRFGRRGSSYFEQSMVDKLGSPKRDAPRQISRDRYRLFKASKDQGD